MDGQVDAAAPEPADQAGPGRLAVLKALGDNTRYAIYLELARSAVPLATADIAATLGLHPNTVRPQLERMREVGLLDVEADTRGAVGRPQNRYSLAADAPSLGLEPAAFPALASMLVSLAASSGIGGEEAAEAGREQGRADAPRWAGRGCLAALEGQMAVLGFDPAVAVEDDLATLAFTHCPFRALAESHPELICNLHRGLVEGLVEEVEGGEVITFHPLIDRTPCQVDLRTRPNDHEPVATGSR